ncbi:MAG TPA: RNA polymerase subunit sigma [Porphyromonadaceae bacterium]|jgi:RNA polymerase sigma-70 factor (ECF subfamily)|uniref:RNA polymerase sigma factor n=1 Tax=Candidatus Caccoplasma intestinavium TaxID=2840716 RepID=A0A9D1GGD9_9BACT|nr:RNA polymerase subunit sigma [Porphyromonadaceae bacterium]HIT39779.1 RNA polymerase sigma factor [Candidatus Caccoplasma intestinavium]
MEKEEMTDYLIGNQEEMYQWAYRLTRNYDDAQDLLQSTLLCALKSVGMYTEENNISGWLYTIMRNIFFNTTRHSGRCCCMEKEDIERMMQLGENALNDNAEIAFDMSDIQRAIDTLDRPYKIPMSLYLSGYKYQEIAEKMGIPLGTVKSRIHASRVQLQETLKDFRK